MTIEHCSSATTVDASFDRWKLIYMIDGVDLDPSKENPLNQESAATEYFQSQPLFAPAADNYDKIGHFLIVVKQKQAY